MRPVLLWLKRDLRALDNRALKAAAQLGPVMPVFVVDLDILDGLGAYDGRLGFLLSALRRLAGEMPLHVLVGRTAEAFRHLLEKYRPRAVVTAEAQSWSGRERDAAVEALCREAGVDFVRVFDGFLADFRRVEASWSFSQFYRRWLPLVDLEVWRPEGVRYFRGDEPGPEEAAARLKYFMGPWRAEDLEGRMRYPFQRYGQLRRLLDGSTRLSPYIRFGLVSPRALFALGDEALRRELAWREYWYHLAHRFPEMRSLELRPAARGLPWRREAEPLFRGETGYPIVDAAVRQLKAENWIHNGLRMLLASFLTKDLLADWRLGEAFFRRHLIDYDEVVNTGNWQWAASVGTDYMVRIFNPVLQARRLDPHCRYIRRWLPEVAHVDCRCLQDPLSCRIPSYPRPVVDHREAARRARAFFGKKGFD